MSTFTSSLFDPLLVYSNSSHRGWNFDFQSLNFLNIVFNITVVIIIFGALYYASKGGATPPPRPPPLQQRPFPSKSSLPP